MKKGTAFRVVILDADITVGTSIGATSQKLRSIDPSVKLIISSGYIPGPDLTETQSTRFRCRATKTILCRAPFKDRKFPYELGREL